MEELGGVAVWPQVRLGTMALTAQDEALGPVNNPPRPTPGFTLAAAGLVEAVTRSQAEDILGRLTCRHSGGCLCACVCTRVCLGGQWLEPHFGPIWALGEGLPVSFLALPQVYLPLQWTTGLVSPRQPWPLPPPPSIQDLSVAPEPLRTLWLVVQAVCPHIIYPTRRPQRSWGGGAGHPGSVQTQNY